jgi:hypothetical protein
MRVRVWAAKILWFVFGAIAVGMLMFTSAAYSKRPEPAQDILQRVESLERRVKALEAVNAAEAKERERQDRVMNSGRNR